MSTHIRLVEEGRRGGASSGSRGRGVGCGERVSGRHPSRARRQGPARDSGQASRRARRPQRRTRWTQAPGTLVLTADPSRCLLLYPRAAWEPIQARLMALSSFNEQIRGLQRLLVGHADDVDIDANGRILVPPALRQYASLDHHVVLVGQGNKFELWDETQWQEQTARAITFPPAACRPSSTASRSDARWRPRPRPARRSRRRAGDRTGRHLRRRDVRPRRARRDASSPRSVRAAAWSRSIAIRTPKPPRAPSPIRASRSAARGSPSSPTSSPNFASASARSTACSSTSASLRRRSTIPARGFSFRADGPLDMRMDPTRGESAAAFLARADVRELTEVIRDYGEERFAQSIARAIVAARAVAPIVRTRQLAALVAQAVRTRPRGDWGQDPATRTFQALRIFVNRELAELALTLPRIVPLLRPGGRLAVISFHSLEDRIVKRFFARRRSRSAATRGSRGCRSRRPRCPARRSCAVGRAIRPSQREVGANPRARSATLRVAERTAHPVPADFAATRPAGLTPRWCA